MSHARSSWELRLEELGYMLPVAPPPAAIYLPFMRTGQQLWVAGQIAVREGELIHSTQTTVPLGQATHRDHGAAPPRAIVIPSHAAINPHTTLAPTTPNATPVFPARINSKVSVENVEKVVNAPRKPMPKTARHSGVTVPGTMANAASAPNRADPTTLTPHVATQLGAPSH